MHKFKLAQNIIDQSDLDSLSKWIASGPHLTKGPLTPQFEREWADWIGTKHAVYVNSGSSANLLMAYAAQISGRLKNNKVIVPAVGWVTTVSPFMQLGFEPIMCGADPDNFGMDLDQLENLVKQHEPSLVIYVQVLGVPGDMDKLMALKEKYGFMLLEDACAALGAEFGRKKIGSFSDMSSFSFYYGHQLSTVEGGMVNTNDLEMYNLMLMLRSHGWGKDLEKQTKSEWMKKHDVDDWHEPFTFFVPGFNLRNTDIGAFLGLRMMQKADNVKMTRNRNHIIYSQELITVEYQKWNAKSFPCSISFGALAKDPEHRKKIVSKLDENDVETRLFSAGNLGRHPFWMKKYGVFEDLTADRIHNCGFFLPNHESLNEDDIKYISTIVNESEA